MPKFNQAPSPQKPNTLLKKGFTLVEILIVVIIVGLLAGLAIIKLADSRERADANYLKAMVRMMESGIETVLTKEGTFPTISGTTPEERVGEILSVLESRDIIVYLESKYGSEWTNAYQQYLASQSANSINDNLSKIRGSNESGSPLTREILVLPVEGPIVYPVQLVIQVNDPESPDLTFHYDSFWLPRYLVTAEENLQNGTGTDEDVNLVLNNVTKSNLDLETIKDLMLENGTDSETATKIASDLAASLASGNTTLSPEDTAELLSQLLGSNADLSAVNFSNLDFSELAPEVLTRLASHNGLTATQIEYLTDSFLDSNNGSMLATLAANPSLTDAEVDSILSTMSGHTLADYADWQQYGNANTFYGQLITGDDPILAGKALASKFISTGLIP